MIAFDKSQLFNARNVMMDLEYNHLYRAIILKVYLVLMVFNAQNARRSIARNVQQCLYLIMQVYYFDFNLFWTDKDKKYVILVKNLLFDQVLINVFFHQFKTVLNTQMIWNGTVRNVMMASSTTKTKDNVFTVIFRNAKNANGFNLMVRNTNHVSDAILDLLSLKSTSLHLRNQKVIRTYLEWSVKIFLGLVLEDNLNLSLMQMFAQLKDVRLVLKRMDLKFVQNAPQIWSWLPMDANATMLSSLMAPSVFLVINNSMDVQSAIKTSVLNASTTISYNQLELVSMRLKLRNAPILSATSLRMVNALNAS